jgi:hypothetical protein
MIRTIGSATCAQPSTPDTTTTRSKAGSATLMVAFADATVVVAVVTDDKGAGAPNPSGQPRSQLLADNRSRSPGVNSFCAEGRGGLGRTRADVLRPKDQSGRVGRWVPIDAVPGELLRIRDQDESGAQLSAFESPGGTTVAQVHAASLMMVGVAIRAAALFWAMRIPREGNARPRESGRPSPKRHKASLPR